MAAVFQAAAQIPSVAVLVQDKTPPGLFGWNKAGAGTLASIESAMQKGLGSSGKYSVLTRSQFDAILAEQNLAYKNVVNNRARLGRLSGTDYIVVAELISDRKDTRHERITAYGFSETQTTLSSEAQLAVGVMDVSSGAVVTQQAFAASIPDSHRALPAVLDQTAVWLGALRLRHARIRPMRLPGAALREDGQKGSRRRGKRGEEQSLVYFLDDNAIGFCHCVSFITRSEHHPDGLLSSSPRLCQGAEPKITRVQMQMN